MTENILTLDFDKDVTPEQKESVENSIQERIIRILGDDQEDRSALQYIILLLSQKVFNPNSIGGTSHQRDFPPLLYSQVIH